MKQSTGDCLVHKCNLFVLQAPKKKSPNYVEVSRYGFFNSSPTIELIVYY